MVIRLRTLGILTGVLALGALIVLLRLEQGNGSPSAATAERQASVMCAQVASAYRDHASGIWVTLSARVVRILPDSYGRFEHQRFVVQCNFGQTVLIVNDVSVGRRAPVHAGDAVVVRGQYVWNRLGGLVHFTHHDSGGGQSGWILVGGRVYALLGSSPGHASSPRTTTSGPALSMEGRRTVTASSTDVIPRSPIASIPAPTTSGATKSAI